MKTFVLIGLFGFGVGLSLGCSGPGSGARTGLGIGGSGEGGGEVATTTPTGQTCAADEDCADGDLCTRDKCKDGICAHAQVCGCPAECDPYEKPYAQKLACDDGNPWTFDRCSPVEACDLGKCSHVGVECDYLDPIEVQHEVCDDGLDCSPDRCKPTEDLTSSFCSSEKPNGCCTGPEDCDPSINECFVGACGILNQCILKPSCLD